MVKKLYSLFILFLFFSQFSFSATYYNRTGTRYCNNLGDWTVNAAGGAGASPGNFTTSGDIFNVRAATTMDQNNVWSVGSGVTVNVYGTLLMDGGNNMTYNTNSILNVYSGGTFDILQATLWGGTLTLPSLANTSFKSGSTERFDDGLDQFKAQYTYGNLIFNDGNYSPPAMGANSLNVLNDFTLIQVGSSGVFTLSKNASNTHSIGGNLNLTPSSSTFGKLFFYVAIGTGNPTLSIGGNVNLNDGGNSSGEYFIVSGGSGNPTVTITGSVNLTVTTWCFYSASFFVCNSTGSATVTTGAVNITNSNTSASDSSDFIVVTKSSSGVSPTFTVNGNLTLSGYAFGSGSSFNAIFAANKSAAGTPVVTINGNVSLLNAWAIGSSNAGNAKITVTGNWDMSSSPGTANTVTHVTTDNAGDGSNATTIGNVIMTIGGDISLGANGHMDLSYNTLGGIDSIYVGGSVTGSANSVFGGIHGGNKTTGAPTIIFKSPASGTATGTFWATPGDFDAANNGYSSTHDSRVGIGQYNIIIQNNRIITLTNNIDLGTNRYFTVQAGGTLITGTPSGTQYVIDRRFKAGPTYATTTSFTLSDVSGGNYATLETNSTNAAGALLKVASGYAGSIQTDTRYYSSSGIYKFSSNVSQTTGDFSTVTGPTANAVYQLIVNNTNATITNGLTLTNPITITNNLNFIAGRLKTTTTNLATVDVNGTASGYGTTSANTAYVDGPIAKNSNSTSAFLFPTGKSNGTARYRPATLTPATSTAVTYRVEFQNAATANTGNILAPVTWVEPNFYWDIIYTSGTNVNAKVQLYYDNADTSSSYKYTGVGQYLASKWTNEGATELSPVFRSTTSSPALTTIPAAVGVSPFALIASNSPLPVELVSFIGKKMGKNVELKWITASELNNNYFTIERSLDGISFEDIAKINGFGTTDLVHHYSFVDSAVPSGILYYRLKQTDFDGAFKFSEPIALDFLLNGNMSVKASPNLVDNVLVINADNSINNATLKIYNLNGSLMFSKVYTAGESVDVSNLSSGLYMATILTPEGMIGETKFIKK